MYALVSLIFSYTYDGQGNLTCIICRSIIKSATVWKVHINSKQHKQNVEEAKLLKTQILHSAKTLTNQSNVTKSSINNVKTPATTPALVPIKTTNIDTIITATATASTKPAPSIPATVLTPATSTVHETHASAEKGMKKTENTGNTKHESVLPEAFFDEPVNKNETKDLQDEEWERFQREIKEETIASNIIIAGEQHEATVDRHIEEIDEQIQHWSKVLDFEEKIEKLQKTQRNKRITSCSSENSSSDNDDILDDFLLNWRSKSLK